MSCSPERDSDGPSLNSGAEGLHSEDLHAEGLQRVQTTTDEIESTGETGGDEVPHWRRPAWQAPEDLHWRLLFLLSSGEVHRIGSKLHERLFPGKVMRRQRMRARQYARVKAQTEGMIHCMKSAWQSFRLCGIGCCAVMLQCVTCCHAAHCMKDSYGVGPAGYSSSTPTTSHEQSHRHSPESSSADP